MFNRDGLRGLIVGLILGSVLGFFLANRPSGNSATVMTVAPQVPAAAPAVSELQSRLFADEQATGKDPNNPQAWTALGNDYFDDHQPQKAVDAYAKSLALDPNNPDVLTDQGVMYRELKAYDKAIANWEKAQKINPKHLQSLYNMGIVYAGDLMAPDKARKACKRLIELAPNSQQAAEARVELAKLDAKP
jgi:tetratricopeptide (TPR) repeat protein